MEMSWWDILQFGMLAIVFYFLGKHNYWIEITREERRK
jgi:hypothetical protein